jgi:hypothetical protein
MTSQGHLALTPLLLVSATSSLISRGLGLALLFLNCSLRWAAHLEHHGPLVGVSPSMRFRYRRSPVIVTGTSLGGWIGVLASARLVALEPVPARSSKASRGPSSRTNATVSY